MTLTVAHKFDAYFATHPQSALYALWFTLLVGFNIGFVGTWARAALLR